MLCPALPPLLNPEAGRQDGLMEDSEWYQWVLAWEHVAMWRGSAWLSPRSLLLNVGTQGPAAAFVGKRYT